MGTTFAVSGKGGTGKTTVASLVIHFLKRHREGAILALDADPDANLGTVLGIPPGSTIGDLREESLAAMKDFPLGMSKEQYIEAGLHEIIVESEGVDLLAMGRAEGPGCYCYLNNMLRKFSDALLPAYRWVVMDNEAGMEHISRQTTTGIDHFLIVVNETPLATDCARRVVELIGELKNPVVNTYLVLNGVREERVDAVRDRVSDLDLKYLGNVPWDDTLGDAIFHGTPILQLENSPAITRITEMMQHLQ